MSKPLKFASWVTREHLDWIDEYNHYHNEILSSESPFRVSFSGSVMELFLSSEESKPKMKTLSNLGKNFTTKGKVNIEPSILNKLTESILHTEKVFPDSQEITRSIEAFKNVTNRLFDALADRPHIESLDLIPGISKPFHYSPRPNDINDNELKELKSILEIFEKKQPRDVLIEYADSLKPQAKHRASLHKVGKRQPTLKQYRVRQLTYSIIKMKGIETTSTLSGIAPLITHIVELSLIKDGKLDNPISVSDVHKQMKTAIKRWQRLVIDKQFDTCE